MIDRPAVFAMGLALTICAPHAMFAASSLGLVGLTVGGILVIAGVVMVAISINPYIGK